MKLQLTISIIFFSFLISSPILSNNLFNNSGRGVEFKLSKLHYSNSSGEEGLSTFDYDSKGNLSIAVWELLDGTRNSINYYTCDEDGNVTKKYREFSDGVTSTQTYRYNKSGKLIFENFSRSDGKTGKANYEYNAIGDPVKAVCEGLNGWFSGTIKYKIDSRGNKISGAILQNGKRTGQIEYTYDVYNNLIKEHWQFGSVWSQTFIYEYLDFDFSKRLKYSSSNIFLIDSPSRVKKENYDFSNQSGGPSEYIYNDHGKLEKKIFERSDGLKTTTSYLYDNKGTLLKSYRKYADGLTAVFSYGYDSLGRLYSRTFTQPDSVSGSETFFYNEEGKLSEAHYKNMDMWLSGVITFEHDEFGKLTAGHFVGDVNFNAEIEFFYNQKNQLIQIFWQLTDGRTQTYTFEY